MKALKFGLLSILSALALLAASCGAGNVGSPIQNDLNATSIEDDDQQAGLPGDINLDPGQLQGGEHGVSYTPGLPCNLVAGPSFANILGYGWKNGVVTEGALAPSVTLTYAAGTPMPWIAYDFRELVLGRLQTLKISGAGQSLAAYMYNWNTASWNYFGTYDLGMGPASLAVPMDCATNGDTFLILIQVKPGKSTITQIKANVF